jgi:beta-1,2-mannosidase
VAKPVSARLPPWALGPFAKPDGINPVIRPDPRSTFDCPMRRETVRWEALHTFNPAAAVRAGKVHLLYRAEDDSGVMGIGGHCSRLGLAVSDDGLRFVKHPTPVMYPDDGDQKAFEWYGGCEDPRLTATEDGGYVLTYTQHNWATPPRGSYTFHLGIATSRDLMTWEKHGPLFVKNRGELFALNRKAGAIVSRRVGDSLVATPVGGRYLMYWGEGRVFLASSDDLIHWDPVVNADGSARELLAPRPGMFDSGFPEVGPAALLSKDGIVLLYNGVNSEREDLCDLSVGRGAYSGGQALFDVNDPTHLLAQLDEPYIQPSEPFERTGQYGPGTTFTEGLVHFKSTWLLYYGCADSLVGVAVAPSAG